ncbi:MAG TPA: hypothetical protein VMD52_00565 [Patescibacteria group bacterium]|nr:hypothetical protein [Patescibacteria group bacterium]
MRKLLLFRIILIAIVLSAVAVSAAALFRLNARYRIKDWPDLVDHKLNPGGILRPNINEMVKGAYADKPVRYITNSQGFRNDREFTPQPRPGVLRIMYIGDSFVIGYRLGQKDLSAVVMEQEIRKKLAGSPYRDVEVMVVGAMDPFEGRRYFNMYGYRFQPHIVVTGICMGNDIAAAGYRQHHAKSTGKKEAINSFQEVNIGKDFSGSFGKVVLPEDAYLKRDHYPVPAFADTFLEPGFYYRPLLPQAETLLTNFEEVLKGFKDDVEARGARFVAVMFPVREQVYHGLWKRQCDFFALNQDKFDLEYVIDRLSDFFSKNDIAYLDLLPYFIFVAKTESKLLYFPRDIMHWDEDGNKLAGRAIATYLLTTKQHVWLRLPRA